MLKISIPTPCHEDWNAMIPNTQGKHCNTCAKTVVDFTSMTDDEVKHFLLNRKDEKLCGRFRNEQLHRITIDLPHNIFYLQMPLWKKYLAAILIVFSTTLFSCDTHLKGDVETVTETEIVGKLKELPHKRDSSIKDTLYPIPLPSSPTKGVIQMPLIEIQGDIAIEPVRPIDVGIIATPIADTPKVEEQYNKVGEIMFNEKIDSVRKKLKDTANCDKKIYY